MSLKEDIILSELLKDRIRLTAYARAILRDFLASEDFFQAISLKAIRSAMEFNDLEHLSNWLWVVCRSEAIKKLKKNNNAPFVLDNQVLDSIATEFQRTSYIDSEGISQVLERCISKLSSYAQKLVMLRYGQNLTGVKLAQALNKKVNSIYVALSRTHQVLRECMKNQLRSIDD